MSAAFAWRAPVHGWIMDIGDMSESWSCIYIFVHTQVIPCIAAGHRKWQEIHHILLKLDDNQWRFSHCWELVSTSESCKEPIPQPAKAHLIN